MLRDKIKNKIQLQKGLKNKQQSNQMKIKFDIKIK
jgi:hypothetical protein